jgi:hypothetical protein
MTAPSVRQYYNSFFFPLELEMKEREDMNFQSTDLENSSRQKLR